MMSNIFGVLMLPSTNDRRKVFNSLEKTLEYLDLFGNINDPLPHQLYNTMY